VADDPGGAARSRATVEATGTVEHASGFEEGQVRGKIGDAREVQATAEDPEARARAEANAKVGEAEADAKAKTTVSASVDVEGDASEREKG
jgi:hypothetical protein